MTDIVERLRSKHVDTWPLQIGFDELINVDGPDAAAEIERLKAALKLVASMIDAGNYGEASAAARLSALERE